MRSSNRNEYAHTQCFGHEHHDADKVYAIEDEAKHVLRPMPLPLRDVVTENDFESFCDCVDLLLQKHYVLQLTFNAQMTCLSLAIFIPFVIVFILAFAVPNSSPVQFI